MSIALSIFPRKKRGKSKTEQYKDNPDTLEAIRESSNEMSATLRVSVKELNNQQSLNNFVKPMIFIKNTRS